MAADRPTVAVVMATYDRSALVQRAVRAVLDQTWRDFELLVVDDGSTDDTVSALGRITDSRLTVVRAGHEGPCAARNLGLRRTSAEWVTFLDDDDIPGRRWLAGLVSRAGTSTGIVTCGAELRDESGELGEVRLPTPLGAAFDHTTGLYLGGTFMVRTELMRSIEGYDEDLACSHQTDLAWRLLPALRDRSLGVAAVDEPLITLVTRPASARWRSRPEVLLDGAEALLARHRDRLQLDRKVLADQHTVAGVAAARSGAFPTARRHLWSAVRADPRSTKRLARLAGSLLPPLGRRMWA